MRSKFATVIPAVLLAAVVTAVWSSRHPSGHQVWTREPERYLGVKLGAPLSASVPNCLPDDKRLCFDGNYISNEPDPVSASQPIVEDGIVTMVATNFRASAEAQIRRDLRERYGDPQTTYPDDTWKGAVISISVMKPTNSTPGQLRATLVRTSQTSQHPHKNPF